MKSLLVSACLLGTPCRYDGASHPHKDVCALAKHYRLIPVCPEVQGGLPTPRTPSEIIGNTVMTKDGRNVTQNYELGAREALKAAIENGCDTAILKERSPSCGCKKIYNGHFDGILVDGNGIAAALLIKNGIRVLGESEAYTLLD